MAGTKRINGKLVHEVERWEDLLTLDEPRMDLPTDVTHDETIQLYIGRPVLEAILEDNIAAIERNRVELDQDGLAAETDEMLAVRQAFLAWVRAHPATNIFMGIYPEDEGPGEDDECEGTAGGETDGVRPSD